MTYPTHPHPFTPSPCHLVILSLLLLLLVACTPDTPELIITVTPSATAPPLHTLPPNTPTITTQPTPTPTSPLTIDNCQLTIDNCSSPTSLPTPSPTTLQIAQPTVTPTPPPTLIPSPTIVATTISPVQTLPAGQLPAIPRDLLFVVSDTLKLWNHQTNQIETLLLPLATDQQTPMLFSSYTVDSAGRRILAALQTTAENPTYDLYLIERDTRQSRLLAAGLNRVTGLDLSPDGRRAAYIGLIPQPDSYLGWPGQLFIVELDAGAPPTLYTNCESQIPFQDAGQTFTYRFACSAPVWSPDSAYLLWTDVHGLWQGSPGQTPNPVQPHYHYPDEFPRTRAYFPTADWSPNGRYQLLYVPYGERNSRWILDTQTNQLFELPHSPRDLTYESQWLWTQDNHLFTVRHDDTADDSILAERWRIEGNQAILDASFSLNIPDSLYSSISNLAQFSDGRLAYAIANQDPYHHQTRGLFTLSFADQTPTMLNNLPPLNPFGFKTYWLPDGRAAIIENLNDPLILYAPTDNTTLYDLTPTLGPSATSFHWLP